VFHLTQDVTYVVLLITSDKVARSMECLSEQRSQKNHENGIFRILCQDLMIRLVCFIRGLYFDCTTLIYHGQCPSACCLSVASRSSIKTYKRIVMQTTIQYSPETLVFLVPNVLKIFLWSANTCGVGKICYCQQVTRYFSNVAQIGTF